VATRARVFEYAVEVDRNGRMSVPEGAVIAPADGWSPDHLLLAALVRCSIDSFSYHARRAGHAVAAAGQAEGTVTRRESDGRYAFVEVSVRIDAQLTPPAGAPGELIALAERDCFVGASLTVKPEYQWRLS